MRDVESVLSYLPVTVDQMVADVAEFAAGMSIRELVEVSTNRDYSEDERYVVKDEVDTALLSSEAVQSECNAIERLCGEGELWTTVPGYLARLRAHLAEVHALTVQGARIAQAGDPWALLAYWPRAATILDRDNAHAMYLSSDNWTFSVFHRLIEAIEELAGPLEVKVADLLTGGIADIRTSVFRSLGNTYFGLDRSGFVEAVKTRGDWVRPDGLMPLFAYRAAVSASLPSGHPSVKERFDAQVRAIRRIADPRAVRLSGYVDLYRDLYAARAAYDAYEYFGFYAFAKNYVILKLRDHLLSIDQRAAEEFWHSASTYQFARSVQAIQALYPREACHAM